MWRWTEHCQHRRSLGRSLLCWCSNGWFGPWRCRSWQMCRDVRCKSSFRWTEIDTGGSRSRPLSFPCPKCRQTIGAPSWRKSFLRAFYLSLIAIFMFLLFDLRGDLFLGYLGTLLAAVGAIRIADWFVWKRLEPGSSPETDSQSLFS